MKAVLDYLFRRNWKQNVLDGLGLLPLIVLIGWASLWPFCLLAALALLVLRWLLAAKSKQSINPVHSEISVPGLADGALPSAALSSMSQQSSEAPEGIINQPHETIAPLQIPSNHDLVPPKAQYDNTKAPINSPSFLRSSLELIVLAGEYGIASLDPKAGVPPWALELLAPDQEALEARLGLVEMPTVANGLPADRTASKVKRKKDDAAYLVCLNRSANDLSLVGPWWLLADRWAIVQNRVNNSGPKTRKGMPLPELSQDYTSLQGLNGPWAAIKVAGSLDFALTGILASLAEPLALAGISIYALSTWNTDYILVPSADSQKAQGVLLKAGHRF